MVCTRLKDLCIINVASCDRNTVKTIRTELIVYNNDHVKADVREMNIPPSIHLTLSQNFISYRAKAGAHIFTLHKACQISINCRTFFVYSRLPASVPCRAECVDSYFMFYERTNISSCNMCCLMIQLCYVIL